MVDSLDCSRSRSEYRSRHARTVVPAAMLSVIVIACFAGPHVLPIPDPAGGSVLESRQAMFSAGHILGTDLNGNDVLARLLYGGQLSVLIALSANVLGLVFGGAIGASSAYIGGVVDSILMRILDVLIAFPSLILVLAIAHALESTYVGTALALTGMTLPSYARVTRASTLRLREQPFMLYARLSGTSTPRILALHLGPNLAPQLLSFTFLSIGITIGVEGALSYLGLGVPLPTPSWGNMIYHGQQAIATMPSLVLLPSSFLFLTVLCCNLISDAMQIHDYAA